MRRTITIHVTRALPLFLLIAACSSTPNAGTTTSITEQTVVESTPVEQVALQYEADVELISQLWWDQNLSWVDGFDGGLTFWVDNNYPDLECEYDDYMASHFPEGQIDGLVVERIVNAPTIAPDDGWIVPGGLVAGMPARGRVYVMDVRSSRSTPETDTVGSELGVRHVTILDDRAHFFIGCGANTAN